jgi:hypothetical protein
MSRSDERRRERRTAIPCDFDWSLIPDAVPTGPPPVVPDLDILPPDKRRPARWSEFGFRTLAEVIETEGPPESVYCYARDSSHESHVEYQRKGTRRKCVELGVSVRTTKGDLATGKTLDPARRPNLHRVLQLAAENGCPVVIPCASRVSRAESFDPRARSTENDRPTVAEVEAFVDHLAGYGLTPADVLFLHDPDAKPIDDEQFLRRMYAKVKCKPVGRPAHRLKPHQQRARKAKWIDTVLKLDAKGWSARDIAAYLFDTSHTVIHWTTIARWCPPKPKRQKRPRDPNRLPRDQVW